MNHPPVRLSAPKLVTGDRVAVLSPSFAAPGLAPAVHEQAMRRLTAATGLIPVPTRARRPAANRRRASGRHPDPGNQRTAASRRLGYAMGSGARRTWCSGGGRRRDGRQASRQQPRNRSACRRTGPAAGGTAGCGQHRDRTVQPRRRRLPWRSLRAHPSAVDPPVRRSNQTRRKGQNRYRQLCLMWQSPFLGPPYGQCQQRRDL